MKTSNYALMMDAMRLYREAMRTFVTGKLKEAYGDKLWWEQGVAKHFKVDELGRLEDLLKTKKRRAAIQPDVKEMADMLDIAQFRQIIASNWKPVFETVLQDRSVLDSWIGEVTSARNSLSHWAGKDVDRPAALRFVDTCRLVVEAFDEEAAAEIQDIWNAIDKAADKTAAPPALKAGPPQRKQTFPRPRSCRPVSRRGAMLCGHTRTSRPASFDRRSSQPILRRSSKAKADASIRTPPSSSAAHTSQPACVSCFRTLLSVSQTDPAIRSSS